MSDDAATGWIGSARPGFTTLSPDRETVLSFDLEGRPISWFHEGTTYKRSMASVVHGRDRTGGERRRWVVSDAEAEALFGRLLERVAAAPRERLSAAVRERLDRILSWTPQRLLAERSRFEAAYRWPVTILPPDQYLSIVVQATRGCTWNRCTFCSFYQDREFRARPREELDEHLDRVAALFGRAASSRRSLFLADGNALVLSIDRLLPLVDGMLERFPDRPWHGFVDVVTGERKTVREWTRLGDRGLRRVHLGLETGHDPLLEFLNKPGSAEESVRFVSSLKEAGLQVSVILMAGAGGERFAEAHVRDTLATLGRMPLGPGDLVYVSPFLEHPGSEYARRARAEGIPALGRAALDAQAEALRTGSRERLPGVQAARYDLREFLY